MEHNERNNRTPNNGRGTHSSNDRPRRRSNDNGRAPRHRDEDAPRREQHNGSRPSRRFDSSREDKGNSRPQRRFDEENTNRDTFSDSRPQRRFKDNRGRRGDNRMSRDSRSRSFNRNNESPRTPRTQSNDTPLKERFAKGFDDSRPRQQTKAKDDGLIRLNKYIANAGICSRREADQLIAAGSVTVNGEVITEMGYKVKPTDIVAYGGETLRSERKRYFLLNKPKGFITTLDDPQERQTVMMLIDSACNERIYPVGRLDRNTTGLLLFTNDGDMARRLTHPSTRVYKIYHVELNKPVTREDMKQMLEGIELEDGMINVDEVEYVEGMNDKRIVGVALHSGKNRIVRRIFEHLGYEVHKLDRVVFAGLTKKDLPRGRYRELTEKEVNFLKMI